MRNERRINNRWQITKIAQCRFASSTQSCLIKDVSIKGAMIILENTKASLSQICELTIRIIDDLEPIIIDCDAVWQRQTQDGLELGLAFARIRDKDKNKIFRYVFDYFPREVSRGWWQGTERIQKDLIRE